MGKVLILKDAYKIFKVKCNDVCDWLLKSIVRKKRKPGWQNSNDY
jgi:hypothetical protein